MPILEKFRQLSNISGVDEYILVDPRGNIAAHDIKNHKKAAKIVLTCGRNSFAIGKANFKYIFFSRKNQKNFFIFPVGNYYLGVVKQKRFKNVTLVDNIINFLNGLLKKN